jgi:hypothetical protein
MEPPERDFLLLLPPPLSLGHAFDVAKMSS